MLIACRKETERAVQRKNQYDKLFLQFPYWLMNRKLFLNIFLRKMVITSAVAISYMYDFHKKS
jgi:hypothetical protein